MGVLAAGMANADDIPFFISRDVPDYRALMTLREADGPTNTYLRSVVHHRGWTRVEEQSDRGTGVSYGNFFDNVLLSTWKAPDDEDVTSMTITKVAQLRRGIRVKNTKEAGTAIHPAGEACKWWEVIDKPELKGAYGPFSYSCLSSDGIEVATKELIKRKEPSGETQVVRLERTSVAESEVRPPKRLFDPAFWLKPLRNYPNRPANLPDFSARMIGDRSEKRVLRHYPWRFEEERSEDGRTVFSVWNMLDDQRLTVGYSKNERHFEAHRSSVDLRPSSNLIEIGIGPTDLKKSDRYLGESCAWFEVTHLADAGTSECLTPDGVALKVEFSSWLGPDEIYTAVELKRRPVELKEMIPPAELIDPSSWGFTVSD
ncbi:hypothetical protein EFQ99_32065 [Rhizobium vallis]|uniref:Uncharacterized protein n=2 Tax=Rhizobium vallis TaxID=634290 RepID=A0A432PBN9_9HYPH|nr:hypothetical protein EFQ99_32065 [Rhizobium vallis]